jgi:hypothetical protein
VVEGLLAEASLTATDAGYIKATEEHRDVNTVLRGGCRSASPGLRRATSSSRPCSGHSYVDRAGVSYVVAAFWVGEIVLERDADGKDVRSG